MKISVLEDLDIEFRHEQSHREDNVSTQEYRKGYLILPKARILIWKASFLAPLMAAQTVFQLLPYSLKTERPHIFIDLSHTRSYDFILTALTHCNRASSTMNREKFLSLIKRKVAT